MLRQRRGYCGPRPNTIDHVQKRVVLVIQLFDKVKQPDQVHCFQLPRSDSAGSLPHFQVTLETNIMKDLGLDSLDHVEIIMAMEDEFEIEIPDADAERLLTPKDIAQYVCDHDDIYE